MKPFKEFLKEQVIDAVNRFGRGGRKANAEIYQREKENRAFNTVNMLAQWSADDHNDPKTRKKVSGYHKDMAETMAGLERNSMHRVHKRVSNFLKQGNPPAYQHYLSAIDQHENTEHLNTNWERG